MAYVLGKDLKRISKFTKSRSNIKMTTWKRTVGPMLTYIKSKSYRIIQIKNLASNTRQGFKYLKDIATEIVSILPKLSSRSKRKAALKKLDTIVTTLANRYKVTTPRVETTNASVSATTKASGAETTKASVDTTESSDIKTSEGGVVTTGPSGIETTQASVDTTESSGIKTSEGGVVTTGPSRIETTQASVDTSEPSGIETPKESGTETTKASVDTTETSGTTESETTELLTSDLNRESTIAPLVLDGLPTLDEILAFPRQSFTETITITDMCSVIIVFEGCFVFMNPIPENCLSVDVIIKQVFGNFNGLQSALQIGKIGESPTPMLSLTFNQVIVDVCQETVSLSASVLTDDAITIIPSFLSVTDMTIDTSITIPTKAISVSFNAVWSIAGITFNVAMTVGNDNQYDIVGTPTTQNVSMDTLLGGLSDALVPGDGSNVADLFDDLNIGRVGLSDLVLVVKSSTLGIGIQFTFTSDIAGLGTPDIMLNFNRVKGDDGDFDNVLSMAVLLRDINLSAVVLHLTSLDISKVPVIGSLHFPEMAAIVASDNVTSPIVSYHSESEVLALLPFIYKGITLLFTANIGDVFSSNLMVRLAPPNKTIDFEVLPGPQTSVKDLIYLFLGTIQVELPPNFFLIDFLNQSLSSMSYDGELNTFTIPVILPDQITITEYVFEIENPEVDFIIGLGTPKTLSFDVRGRWLINDYPVDSSISKPPGSDAFIEGSFKQTFLDTLKNKVTDALDKISDVSTKAVEKAQDVVDKLDEKVEEAADKLRSKTEEVDRIQNLLDDKAKKIGDQKHKVDDLERKYQAALQSWRDKVAAITAPQEKLSKIQEKIRDIENKCPSGCKRRKRRGIRFSDIKLKKDATADNLRDTKSKRGDTGATDNSLFAKVKIGKAESNSFLRSSSSRIISAIVANGLKYQRVKKATNVARRPKRFLRFISRAAENAREAVARAANAARERAREAASRAAAIARERGREVAARVERAREAASRIARERAREVAYRVEKGREAVARAVRERAREIKERAREVADKLRLEKIREAAIEKGKEAVNAAKERAREVAEKLRLDKIKERAREVADKLRLERVREGVENVREIGVCKAKDAARLLCRAPLVAARLTLKGLEETISGIQKAVDVALKIAQDNNVLFEAAKKVLDGLEKSVELLSDSLDGAKVAMNVAAELVEQSTIAFDAADKVLEGIKKTHEFGLDVASKIAKSGLGGLINIKGLRFKVKLAEANGGEFEGTMVASFLGGPDQSFPFSVRLFSINSMVDALVDKVKDVIKM